MLPSTLRPLARLAGLTFAASLLASPAAGMTFIYEWDPNSPDPIAISGKAGNLEAMRVTYDDGVLEELTFKTVFSPFRDNRLPDGGWLVISDGPSPSGAKSEYAIYYLDRVTSRLTAYVYDGTNGPKSWNRSPFLESFPTAVNAMIDGAGNLTMDFKISSAAINAAAIGPDWKGSRFGDEVGIWFHPTVGTEAEYGPDGSITSWKVGPQGFFDGLEGFQTRQVPEPAASLLAGLVGVALLAAGRRARLRR